MANKDTQKIFVHVEGDSYNDAVVNGVFFSNLLKKELCLYANYRTDKEKRKLEKTLGNISKLVESQLNDLKVSVLIRKGRLLFHIKDIVEKQDGVLFISAHNSKKVIRSFYSSTIPFLMVSGTKGVLNQYEHILVPVDFRSNTKDAALWASYLGRFNDSEITLFPAKDKWTELKDKTDKILRFVKNFYSQFDFDYNIIQGEVSSLKVQKAAANKAHQLGSDMIIASGSSSLSYLERILGSTEKRLLNRAGSTSVMLINPRKELTILCR